MAAPGERSTLRKAARGAAMLWTTAVLITHSDTGVSLPTGMALYFGAMLLMVWFLLAVAIVAAAAWKSGTSTVSAIRPWLPIPGTMLVAVVLLWASVPLKTRLFFSGPALAQSGPWFASLPEGYVYQRRPRVGLFHVREFAQFGDELRFLTSDCGVVDNCGLVYSPSGRPPNRGEDSFEHLYGPWWHWHQSW